MPKSIVMKHLILPFSLVLLACCGSINAAQKQTGPDLRPIPGEVIDHKGIVINPAPVEITYPFSGIFNMSSGFKINIADYPEYKSVLSNLPIRDNGIPLKLSVGKNSKLKELPGGYTLSIGPDDIKIVGYDNRGVFYGLQTLCQITSSLESAGSNDLPMMEIADYPSLANRGVVEGFYGTPWSHDTRLSIIDFMGKNKMNCYVYGPKDDPYHRTPSWREPYPDQEASKIAELAQRCKQNYINFVWAIHPGGDIRWDNADYKNLLSKFEHMYGLGVRQFAIFFDDISGNGTDSHKQAKLLNDLNRDFVENKPDVSPLIVCPTDYNQDWANPSDDGQLAIYGRELNPSTEVFWTGKVVCGDIEKESLDFVDSRIKRPALVWWNFPVTDYCKHNLLLGPVYGLDTTLTDKNLSGLLSNPMENGEASKSALYGVADYGWNPAGYNALDNWTRSFEVVMPGAAEAYGTFAIHSADPPKNYRRNESWNIETFDCNNYTPEQYESLYNEFKRISEVEEQIVSSGKNLALIKELAPWLVEFTNLGNRGLMALELLKIKENGNRDEFEQAHRRLSLINEIQKPGYLNHRSGTLKLQPFIDDVLQHLSFN